MPVSSRKKDYKSTNDHDARVKLRWMELDVEGGTAELVEGLNSFAKALTRGAPLTAAVRTLAAAKSDSNTSTAVIEAPIRVEEAPADAAETETAEELSPETSSGNGADRPRRRPAPKAPNFLSDLDLTKAPVQVADFVQEKKPDGDMEKYAVIAAWFKEHLGIEEISIDHVFTAYKSLGWQAQLPPDPSQTFRNLKSNKNWFDRGSKRGAYRINWNGLTAVNKMGATKS